MSTLTWITEKKLVRETKNKQQQQRNKVDASRCKNNINENSIDNGGEKM